MRFVCLSVKYFSKHKTYLALFIFVLTLLLVLVLVIVLVLKNDDGNTSGLGTYLVTLIGILDQELNLSEFCAYSS